MSDNVLLNETLSALLDQEAGKGDSLELRRLVRAMESDPALAATFARYARQSAVMRGENATRSVDFLKGVQERLASPAAAPAPSPIPAHSRWRQTLGQVAVAASVAVVAVWLVRSPASMEFAAEPGVLAAPATPAVTPVARLGEGVDNRLLAPRVLTVNAGAAGLPANRTQEENRPADCVMLEGELPADSALHRMVLPEGMVLCQLDREKKHCQAVSATLACYAR